MEAMLAADQLLEADDQVGPLPEEEELDEEEMARKYEEAMALNAQLKAMMMQAEEQQRREMARRQQQRGGGRPMVDTRRQEGGAMHRGQAPSVAGARPLGVAKNGGWGGQTHTDSRAREINRDNAILVQKLSNVALTNPKKTQEKVFRIPTNRTSVAINQRRKDDQIARENAAMARRLNSVKPTKALSAKATAQHAAKHSSYLKVLGQPGAMRASAGVGRPRVGSAAAGRSALPVLRMHGAEGGGGWQQ